MTRNESGQQHTVKVSICIPAYENAAGIQRLLASIYQQTYTDYEIILTDDSRSDAVRNMVDARVQYYHNETALGPAANWNAAIAHASGAYIKIMHHDDWFTDADSLGRFVALLDENPQADMAFCGTWQVSPDGGRKARHISREDADLLRADYRNLYLGNTIGAPSAVIVRRSAIMGGDDADSGTVDITYDPALSWLVDMDYYLEILTRNPAIVYTESPLISIGLSDGQLTNRVQNHHALQRREYRYVYRKHRLGRLPACRRKYHDTLYKEVVNGIADVHVGPVSAGRVTTALFWLALTIEILLVVVDKSNLHNPYTGQIYRLTFLMFGTSFLTTRFTRREMPWLIFFLLLGVLSWRISGRNEILRFTVFAAACVHRNGRRILQYMLWLTAAGCAALIALSVTGVYGTLSRTEDFGTGVTTRYCLGLGHPNALHCMAMMIVMLFVYLYDRRMRLWIYVLLLAADICLYGLTESATGAAVWAFDILISALLHYNKRLRNLDAGYHLVEGGVLAGFLLTVWGAVTYPRNSWILSKADAVMTGRLASLWDTTFHEGTLSTWTWMGSRSNMSFFDLGWIRVIYWYGLVPAVIILCGLAMMLALYRRRRDAAAWTFLMSCILYTLVEAHLVSEFLGRNPLLVMAAMCVPALLHEDKTL